MVQEINTPYIPLRIKFSKTGDLQYISHLDLVRTMHKALIRAKLPLWYSEGFNPKPKMVFSPPLSIGVQSGCEFLDVRLIKRLDTEDIVKALRENLDRELYVIDAYYPTTKLSDIAWYSYEMTINSLNASESLAAGLNSACNGESLFVEKNTKKGLAQVDIRPLIHSFNAVFSDGVIKVNATLSADPSALLNPELLIKCLNAECGLFKGESPLNEYYSIMRKTAYTKDMTVYE